MDVSNPKDVFYADVPDPLASEAIDHLRLESSSALTSPSPPPAWPDSAYNGRRAYIHTLQDKCIPSIAQKMMIKYSGVEWVVKDLNTSHSPFLSQPKQLFNDLVGLAKDYATSSSWNGRDASSSRSGEETRSTSRATISNFPERTIPFTPQSTLDKRKTVGGLIASTSA